MRRTFKEDAKMTASAASQKHDFYSLLAASERSPEIPEENDAYGWLVGSWDLEVLHYAAVDVAPLHIRGIQDVWIMPRVSERNANLAKTNNMYGTTLRIWDESIQAWRIRWINPVTNHYEQQTGRRVGPRKDDDIVQVGARMDGTATRWRFTEITPDSFHWIGESLDADGVTWKLEGEFRCKRMQ
jgi:hypothetical protein